MGPWSRAAVELFATDTVLRLDQQTQLQIPAPPQENSSLLDLIKGAIYLFTREPRALDIKTPFVNAAVEGTEFMARVNPDNAAITVFEGGVSASNSRGQVSVVSGEGVVTGVGQAPQRIPPVRPQDAVQWTLYYPTILPTLVDPFSATGATLSSRYTIPTDVAATLKRLETLPQARRNADFFAFKAALLLTVGRVPEAQAEARRALIIEPRSSEALALLAIIGIGRNENEAALALAEQAVEHNPNSAAARLALSYARQALFDLRGALDNIRLALENNPENPLLWARLSELSLSQGKLDSALEAARQAVKLNPDLARTQTVLGFAYIDEVEIGESKQAFEQAIQLDQADPLPRLGLGLATIRGGALGEGRREIEIAVSLAPNNSLLRSYMGKAYYAEKRSALAESQYEMAKALDPRDPTPWFYDAIRKQTVNRPVEALRDLQKSIELNDNRAVFRSRLLLDQDLAARSASLGRIYGDLGFQQIALVEGWKSLSFDPSDFSGHRFLADTYSTLPRHETARVSELLQSQLLQPINITPVQPRLAEADLFLADLAGPSTPSFREFNPLFNRNRLGLLAGGVVGGNDTLGDEIVVSGIWNRISFSLGQFHLETDGFRDNHDQKSNIYNAFVQASLSAKASVQGEFRFSEIDNGDLSLRFEPDDFSASQREDERLDYARGGFHYAFGPGSDLIASVIYGDLDANGRGDSLNQFMLPTSLDVQVDDNGWTGEAQYLWRGEGLRITGGVGYFHSDRRIRTRLDLSLPFPPFAQTIEDDNRDDVSHANGYVYSQVNLADNVILTLGASGDVFDSDDLDRSQFNPKLGVAWYPFPSTSVRAAAFRTLHRSLVSRQTIEPTNVAGFNQFFAGVEGEEAWRYGLGVDHKFSRSLYSGGELSYRDLEVPIRLVGDTTETQRFSWDEQLGRAYLYWTPTERLALSAEYQYERFDRNKAASGTERIVELTSHRVPLGVRYFHPSGFFASTEAAYIHQDGRFGRGELVHAGHDDFWVIDGAIGYRLPKRYGIVTLDVRNVFDETFRFQDTDPSNPKVSPERLVLLGLTLSF